MKHYGGHNRKRWLAAVLTSLITVACGGTTPIGPASTIAPAANGPQLLLTPSTGALNAQLSIDGGGFPSDTQVRVEMKATDSAAKGGHPSQFIGQVRANSSGQFKLVLIVPRTWTDGSPIVDRQLTFTAVALEGGESASAVFNNAAADDPNAPASATSTSANSSSQPAIALSPASGAAGTQVTASGERFPASTHLVLRLGEPGAGAGTYVYAESISGRDGKVSLAFGIPSHWADGQPISSKILVVLVGTDDSSVRALAEFHLATDVSPGGPLSATLPATTTGQTPGGTLTPPATQTPRTVGQDGPLPIAPDPITASVDFLYSLLRDPSGASSVVYLSQRLRSEISDNWVLPTGLGIQPGYNSFVVVLISKSEDSVLIQATLSYESGASLRNFTLIREAGNWRIDEVVAGSH